MARETRNTSRSAEKTQDPVVHDELPPEDAQLGVASPEEDGKLVLKMPENGLVEDGDDDFFGGDASEIESGYGDADSGDVALPRLTILQGLSPQVDRNAAEYIDGSKQGDIINTATGRIVDPATVVFAAYERRYVEWSPRQKDKACPFSDMPKPYGEGLIQDHGTDGSILDECRRWEENGSYWTKSGNELVPTATWYGVMLDTMSPFFIGMGKTQFTASKKIMSAVREEKLRRGGTLRVAPIFWRSWTMSGTLKIRDDNKWYVWGAKPGVLLKDHPDGKSMLGVIKDLQESIKTHTVKVDMNESDSESVRGSGYGAGSGGDDSAM